MTNYGFHAAMRARGRRRSATTQVGDRYVLEELRARGWTLGGEQSGHIIDMGFNRTGDGIASALLTLEALGGRGPRASATRWRSCRSGWSTCACATATRSTTPGRSTRDRATRRSELAGRGRVLVRPSGTEPLVRVMVEAPTDEEAEEVCERAGRARRARAGLAPRSWQAGRWPPGRWYLRSDVRNRWLRRQATPGPGAAARGSVEARVPRL